MEAWMWTVTAVAVGLVAVLAAASLGRAHRAERDRRRDRLRVAFGPEYEDEVARVGRRAAEQHLEQRADDLGAFEPPAVEPLLRAELAERWARLQLSFVDDPEQAVRRADELVVDLLADRGHDVDTAEARLVAVAHEVPDLADAYRRACATLGRPPAVEDPAATGTWRELLLVLKDVFEALVDGPTRADEHGGRAVDRFT